VTGMPPRASLAGTDRIFTDRRRACARSPLAAPWLSNRTFVAPSDPDGGFNTNPAQPFAIDQPLSLAVESLRANNAFVTRFRAGSTTYDFLPQCVGNLVTGNDQWGNHWVVPFQLDSQPVIH
jgi:hypothetical protein